MHFIGVSGREVCVETSHFSLASWHADGNVMDSLDYEMGENGDICSEEISQD